MIKKEIYNGVNFVDSKFTSFLGKNILNSIRKYLIKT